MITRREGKSLILRLSGLAVLALLCLGNWAAAKAPIADFPSFIPFTGDLATTKVGDVAADKIGNLYINLTQNGMVRIWKFSPVGEWSLYAEVAPGISYGLAVQPNGDIYSIVNGGSESGVYRVDRQGNVNRLPGTENIFFPNAMAFDPRGNLYVTESRSVSGEGGIWRIPPGGEAELMVQHELLTGTGVLGAKMGANGIGYYHGNLYVVNSDKGFIVQIPIFPDGGPGEPSVWFNFEEIVTPLLPAGFYAYPIFGDGVALDVFGNIYVTSVFRCAVIKINADDLTQETAAALGVEPDSPLFAPLDTPNTIAFGTGKGGKQVLFVTNMHAANIPSFPGRGLVKIEAGVPGRPLP